MTATSKSADDMPEAQKSSEEMTVESVDRALDEVRPYLISDGGNVEVVSVKDGAVALRLAGACGDCPSSTTTMKMGLERRLREVFGDAVTDVYQVQLVEPDSTVDTVNTHLDFLRPAISNYGGSVEVLKVENGVCEIKYEGPEVIWEGVSTSITDRFPEASTWLDTLLDPPNEVAFKSSSRIFPQLNVFGREKGDQTNTSYSWSSFKLVSTHFCDEARLC
ncbi:hypothetical protein CYMTET_11301 [Cymbomonas tetramitiformis]|uniref:NIF system FeS cluster assembly NifU C-terminal domain-containing protein n=1 Tax=Cymbomonas tetramitiformis TaxID=36881 RepID=A0AAE0GML7_9CHLO|nr:hypothetical protein CYMTET_11301 [Cymbomonas tetramitiformis]